MLQTILSHPAIEISADTPRIYCACLSSYTNDILFGQWISADQDPEDIREEIENMLSESPLADTEEPCEKYAIHDYENFQGVQLNEYESLDYVSALAQALEQHGKAFSLYLECFGSDDIETALESFDNNYHGCFESAEDYAEDYYEQTGQLETIEQAGLNRYYIDWKAIAHDWQCSGDLLFLEESHNEIHVFYNH